MLNNCEIVILCIGTEKVCGDMLGPLVGDILINEYNIPAFVYGNLRNSANGLNINNYVNFINKVHPKCILVSIDSAVGEYEDIGKIKLKPKGLTPGASLGRNEIFKSLGIVGVVASSCGDVVSNLLSASYELVNLLAIKIAEALYKSIITIVN